MIDSLVLASEEGGNQARDVSLLPALHASISHLSHASELTPAFYTKLQLTHALSYSPTPNK